MYDVKGALSRYLRERTHRRRATIVTVPLLLAATIAGAQLVREPAPARQVTQAPTSPRSSPGSISPDISSASCVEQYGPTTLKGRAFAFDGTVSRVAATTPPSDGSVLLPGYSAVTFNVHEWFRGGDQATVTVDLMSSPTPDAVSSVETVGYDVGTRLLVSGEPRFGGGPLQAPIAWPCGFTRHFDQLTATAWRQTLENS